MGKFYPFKKNYNQNHPLISCYRRHSEILTVSGQWTLNVTVSRQNRLIFSRQREQPIRTLQANPPYFQHRGHLFCDVMTLQVFPLVAGWCLTSKLFPAVRFSFVLKRGNVFVNFGILLKDE